MYHWQDGWFFGRMKNGDVRILKFSKEVMHADFKWPNADDPYIEEVSLDETINKYSWCSVIASVCARGETGETFDAAKAFHGTEGK